MPTASISDAEWQVMNVIWDQQPLTAQEVVAALAPQAGWAAATIKTMLHRLVKKDILTYEQHGNRYVYRSLARRSDCVRQASRSFLQRVFDGNPTPLLTHFLKSSTLQADEIAQLRRILDEKESR